MSHKPVRSSTYRVTTEPRQQRILRAIQRVNNPAISAHGTTVDGDFFVTVESTSATSDMHVRRIVVSLDLSATRVAAAEYVEGDSAAVAPLLLGLAIPKMALGGLRRIL